jgi:post-segregation antitoxin (ccd killing protein)
VLKNVTITLDEELLKSARVSAAKRGVSVSKLVGEILAREVRQEDHYWQAFEAWKKIKPVQMTRKIGTLTREEAHERG